MDKIELLYIEFTKLCNSKCITCDYWKNEKDEININDNDILNVIRSLPDLKVILFTGGEALMYADKLFVLVNKIKKEFKDIELRLLTNGFLIEKNICNICKYFSTVVFSFDGYDADIYKIIRGMNWFNKICDSIKLVKDNNLKVRLRCMVIENNYLNIKDIIELAKSLRVDQISFLPVDINSTSGFERKGKIIKLKNNINIKLLEQEIDDIIINNKDLIRNGFLTENGNNLRNVVKFYKNELKFRKCNAPYNSIVLEMNGNIKNCFFTKEIGNICKMNIEDILKAKKNINSRKKCKNRELDECGNCVL